MKKKTATLISIVSIIAGALLFYGFAKVYDSQVILHRKASALDCLMSAKGVDAQRACVGLPPQTDSHPSPATE